MVFHHYQYSDSDKIQIFSVLKIKIFMTQKKKNQILFAIKKKKITDYY